MPRSIRRFRVTTDSRRTQAAPHLVQRVFEAQRPNICWLSDITYIPTKEGWLYLVAILDVYSRAIVGWGMSRTLDGRLAIDALMMAIDQRGTGPQILHSDQGLLMRPQTIAPSCLVIKSSKASVARAIVGIMPRWKVFSIRSKQIW